MRSHDEQMQRAVGPNTRPSNNHLPIHPHARTHARTHARSLARSSHCRTCSRAPPPHPPCPPPAFPRLRVGTQHPIACQCIPCRIRPPGQYTRHTQRAAAHGAREPPCNRSHRLLPHPALTRLHAAADPYARAQRSKRRTPPPRMPTTVPQPLPLCPPVRRRMSAAARARRPGCGGCASVSTHRPRSVIARRGGAKTE